MEQCLTIENCIKKVDQHTSPSQRNIDYIKQTYEKEVDTFKIRTSKDKLHSHKKLLLHKSLDNSIDKVYKNSELKF